MIKVLRKYTLAALVCIPLFFINTKDWTDWGDDFAQYIHQSVNIIKGVPQSETGYIFNPDNAMYAPEVYPSGFPLLLVPVIKMTGIAIYPLTIYITFFLTLFGLLMFAFINRFYSPLISLLLIIIVLYNPWTLSFKADIVSDIPFSFFLLLLTYLFTASKNRSIGYTILISLLCAFTILIRSAGIVFPLALIAHTILELFRNKKFNTGMKSTEFRFSAAVALLSFLLFFVMNKYIFPASHDSLFSYKMLVDFHQLKEIIQTNLTYYTGVLRAFFEPWNDRWQFVSIISASMIFTFIIIGIIRKIASNFSFTDTLFFVYLLIILVYPYSNAGFRFLFPLTPFLLLYLMKGILSVDIGFRFNTKFAAIAFVMFVLFSYKKGISEVVKSQQNITEGPQQSENAEMFRYIIENTNEDARFSFKKPRALALYTGRSSISHRSAATAGEIEKNLNSNHIGFILINREDSDQNMKDFIKINENKIEKIWENSGNIIYKIKY